MFDPISISSKPAAPCVPRIVTGLLDDDVLSLESEYDMSSRGSTMEGGERESVESALAVSEVLGRRDSGASFDTACITANIFSISFRRLICLRDPQQL